MVSLDYFDLISVEKAFFRCKRSVDIRVLLVNDSTFPAAKHVSNLEKSI